MPRDFSIRKVTLDDIGPVTALEQAAFGEHAYPRMVLRQLFDSLPDLFFVAVDSGGQIIGYCVSLFQPGRHDAVLFVIAVSEGCRGKGIGSALIGTVEESLITLGATEHRLTVMPTNSRARAVYEKAGFAVESEDPDYSAPARHVLS